ncbi:MAG: hypothetical protein ACE5H0_11180 [Bacteroidota bacterium]
MVGMKVLPIDQITDKPDFEWWGFVDVYPWECDDWGVDLRYMLSELDLESSGLKPRIINYFDLQGEDTEQVSERIRVTIFMMLRLDQTERYVEVLHDPVAFYDRYADCGRDDYFVNGLDVSDAWFEEHIVPKLRKGLQVGG